MKFRIPVRAACALVTTFVTVGIVSSPSIAADRDGHNRLVQAVKKSVLLFPFDAASLTAPNAGDVTTMLADAVRSRMTISNNYVVTQFSRAVPAIARAKNDQLLSDADTTAPFAEDNRKALKVAKLAQYDVVFVGSVDDYRFDAAKKQASITISGRLLETETDKVLKSVTLSGDSAAGGNGDESEKAIQAARSAVDKLLGQLVPITTIVTTPDTNKKPQGPKKKRANMDWLWGLVVVGVGLGIGIASSGGGGGGGAGGSDNPPPPPN